MNNVTATETPVMDRISKGMAHWGKTMEELKIKGRTLELSTRERLHESMTNLEKQKEGFEERFRDVSHSTELAKDEVRNGLKRAYEDLDLTFQKVRKQFLN